MPSEKCMTRTSKAFFRLGQILLSWGIICFAVSIGTAYWVVRPYVNFQKQNVNPNETIVTTNYGIFVACRQNDASKTSPKRIRNCGSLMENLSISNIATARYIQFVMCLAAILYGASFSLEVVQCLPIDKFRNFIAKNRMVEMFASIATVLVLKGIVIFTGEIKNKAERVPGQEDEEPGWSFAVAMIGLILCVIGIVLVIIFREVPTSSPGRMGGTWFRRASKNLSTTSQSANL